MNDNEIVLALRNRDSTVMNSVITKYSRLLWKIAAEVLYGAGNEEDAEECVADVFIALWEHPEHFDPTRGTLKSWLCLVARSKAIDRYRALKRNVMIPIESIAAADPDGVLEQMMQKEMYRSLADAIMTLEVSERDILLRRYEVGQKPRAIARALGMTVKQVNNSLYRTKQKLRQILTQKEGERP